MKKKLLILVVAFNHEKFIHKVLDRIDQNLSKNYDVEILINDDSSSDDTVKVTENYIKNSKKDFKYTAGWSSLVARQAHNLKVGGSNPSPATKFYAK